MILNYVGQDVHLIYNDQKRKVTFRTIRVLSVRNNQVKAYCYQAQAPRMFRLDRIVDIEAIHHVS